MGMVRRTGPLDRSGSGSPDRQHCPRWPARVHCRRRVARVRADLQVDAVKVDPTAASIRRRPISGRGGGFASRTRQAGVPLVCLAISRYRPPCPTKR